jgi:hypothetical protein
MVYGNGIDIYRQNNVADHPVIRQDIVYRLLPDTEVLLNGA